MEYEYKKGWWETKDHQKIKISDMETSHIKNTINYLKKKPYFYDEVYGGGNWFEADDYDGEVIEHKDLVEKKIKELENELKLRGE